MRMRLGKSLLRSAIVYAYLAVCVAGCATAPLDTSGALSSYADLAPEEGVVTKTKLRVDKASVLKAQSVAIMPTSFSRAALTAPACTDCQNMCALPFGITAITLLCARLQAASRSREASEPFTREIVAGEPGWGPRFACARASR